MKPVDISVPDTSALVETPDCLECLLVPGNPVILLKQVLRELAHLQGNQQKSEEVRAAAGGGVRKIRALRHATVIHKDCSPILTGALSFASFTTTHNRVDLIQRDDPQLGWRSNALTRTKESCFGPYVAQVRLGLQLPRAHFHPGRYSLGGGYERLALAFASCLR